MQPRGPVPGVPIPARVRFAGLWFDRVDLAAAVAALAGRPSAAPFAYLCTPNADFVYWARRRPAFRAVLDRAWLSTNDSRILRRIAAWRGVTLTFAPGSYITRDLFDQGRIGPHDPLTVLGGSAEMVAILSARYGLTRVHHLVPPMGFIHDPASVQAAITAVVAHPARFVFIVMGAPQSDLLAGLIADHGGATGLALNVGSSLGTLAGLNARTPDWMEHSGLVWLYRLISEPRRLWRRYLRQALPGALIALWRGGR